MFNKIATFIAAIAMVVAFSVSAHAQNFTKDAIQFHGTANPNGVASIDVTGNLTGYSSSNPLTVHVTDGTHDVSCLFTTYNANAITYNGYAGNQAGTFTLNLEYAQCENNHNGGLIGATGELTFGRWTATQASGTLWNIQAESAYLQFNCPPLWVVSPFSGVGVVNNP